MSHPLGKPIELVRLREVGRKRIGPDFEAIPKLVQVDKKYGRPKDQADDYYTLTVETPQKYRETHNGEETFTVGPMIGRDLAKMAQEILNKFEWND